MLEQILQQCRIYFSSTYFWVWKCQNNMEIVIIIIMSMIGTAQWNVNQI